MLNDDFRNNEQGNASATYSPTCFKWIDGIVKKAKSEGVFVFACTHHPLLPPVPAYRIGADYKNMRAAYVGHMLADMGIELVFSGHTHFSDIGFMRSDRGALLCDITSPSVRFYPPEYRVAEIDGEKGVVDIRSVEVDSIDGFDLGGKTLKEHMRASFYKEYEEKVASLPSPVNSLIANMRVKHIYPLCRRAAGLSSAEYEKIKDTRIFDLIIELALNMLGGDGAYTPDTPEYKFMMGLSAVLDSIIETQPFYDVRKNVLKGYTVSEIIEPMLFNNGVGDSNTRFNFRTEPEKRCETHPFTSSCGDIVMAALCVIMCLLASFLASALGGLIYSFLTISLRTNQNVTGLTLTILGSGVGNFFGGSLNKLAGGVGQVSVAVTSQAFRNYSYSLVNFFDGFTGKLRLGTLLFSYGFLTYVAIILAVAIWFFLSKTRTGLSLRAIGENTATADAAGINVTKYKYLATCIGAGISGLGGTYYVMNYIKGTWENQGTIEALGWLAVALVIFATWKSLRAIWGSYLFGVLYWAYNYIPGLSRSTLELFKMLPYVVTILVLLMVSMRKKKEDQPPQSLGIPYFREER